MNNFSSGTKPRRFWTQFCLHVNGRKMVRRQNISNRPHNSKKIGEWPMSFFNIVQNAFDTNEWGRTKDVNTHRKTLETVRVFHSSHQVFQAHVMLATEIKKPWLTVILSINDDITPDSTLDAKNFQKQLYTYYFCSCHSSQPSSYHYWLTPVFGPIDIANS